MIDFLKLQEIIDLDVSEVELELEELLIERMRIDIANGFYDFMHGALGVGLYFLQRKNYIIVTELLEALYNLAEKAESYMKWKSTLNYVDIRSGFNIALSHGMSSIIIFLSRVINQMNIKHDKLYVMLSGAVNYVLKQEIKPQLYGSFFPHFSLEEYDDLITGSRLAWCYGDLGIAIALWQAGIAMQNDDWMNKSLEIFEYSICRKTIQETGVIDSSFCHGSVGVASIYRRMYINTGKKEFQIAVNSWIKRTLDNSTFIDGLAGYKTCSARKWVNDYSLLKGISGIGLSFLSYLIDDNQPWDTMFLLS